MVAANQFRADLYHRLRVYPIHIPPLRERPEDIVLQFRHYLRLYQTGTQPSVVDLSPPVLDALRSWPWGGNTRQLQNVVRETLLSKREGSLVQLSDLPQPFPHLALAPVTRAHASQSGADDCYEDYLDAIIGSELQQGTPLRNIVDDFERRLLKAVLQQNDGNRKRSAVQFGLSPQALYKKLKKYGQVRPRSIALFLVSLVPNNTG